MQKLIDEIKKTSGDMAHRGWAESNGGNISLRLNPENYMYFSGFQPRSDWVKLPIDMPEITGERFLVTGTGRFLRNIEVFPEFNPFGYPDLPEGIMTTGSGDKKK